MLRRKWPIPHRIIKAAADLIVGGCAISAIFEENLVIFKSGMPDHGLIPQDRIPCSPSFLHWGGCFAVFCGGFKGAEAPFIWFFMAICPACCR